MIETPKKLLLAIEAVLDIAYNAGGNPVQSNEITERQGISRRYLEPVLQQLVRAGILKGVRGPRGGYRLARERRRISVGDIARVVRSVETAEKSEDAQSGSDLGQKVVQPLWDELQDEMMKHLNDTTIDDLCDKARSEGIESEGRRTLDFTI